MGCFDSCLIRMVKRVLLLWNQSIAPAVKADQRVIIAAYRNNFRALVIYVDIIYDKDIADLDIPSNVPVVYKLNHDL